jgi:ABC-type transport system involved in multi-copper enzyme maturation permease subunit
MTLNLALYKRALLLDSRRLVLYASWLLMGSLMFIFLVDLSDSSSGVKGLRLLSLVAYTNFWFILFAGIFGFSSSITEEKEDDTIGLLVMTGISPLNFVLSKAGARFTRGLFLIASQIPFTMFAVTLGGVSSNQVYAVYITLLSFMFMLTFFCTFISLISPNNRFAATFSFLLILGSSLLAPLLLSWDIINYSHIIYFIPSEALGTALATGFSDNFIPAQLYSNLLEGLFFFILTLVLFHRQVLKEPKTSSKKKTSAGKSARRRCWSNSLAWKEFYFQLGGFKSWLLQGLIYTIVIIIILYYSQPYESEAIKYSLFGTSLLLFILLLTIIVSNMFSSEFKLGTHSSLFTLPMDHLPIALSKLLGGVIYSVPTLVVLLFTFSLIIYESGAPELDYLFTIFSFALVYLCLTAYLSLMIRIGSFIAAAGLIVIFYIFFGFIFSRSSSGDGIVIFMGTLNVIASCFFIFCTNNKIIDMKGR